MTTKTYFVQSADCKLVKGLKRSVIIDYGRYEVYFLTHKYHKIMDLLNSKSFQEVEVLIDEDSKSHFHEFVEYLVNYEIGFFTETPERFPKISEEYFEEEYIQIQDAIIEIDDSHFSSTRLKTICSNLNDTNCKDFQIRLLSNFNIEVLKEVVQEINNTQAVYIEIHCTYLYDKDFHEKLQNFVENQTLVSNIYVYNAPKAEIANVFIKSDQFHEISLGNIYYINYPFNEGNCCGIINLQNLNFLSMHRHNYLKTKNGCLDKKIAIDRFGNIKNCPSMEKTYGSIDDTPLKEVILNESFTKLWNINKDQISICKVCEFRYNCTDCRAFIEDSNDIYSKPLKCGYNPNTCEWEESSKNSLKDKGVFIK